MFVFSTSLRLTSWIVAGLLLNIEPPVVPAKNLMTIRVAPEFASLAPKEKAVNMVKEMMYVHL